MLILRDREGNDVLGGDIGAMVKAVDTGCDTVLPIDNDAGVVVDIDTAVAVDIAVAAAVVVAVVVGLFLCNKFLIAFMIQQMFTQHLELFLFVSV